MHCILRSNMQQEETNERYVEDTDRFLKWSKTRETDQQTKAHRRCGCNVLDKLVAWSQSECKNIKRQKVSTIKEFTYRTQKKRWKRSIQNTYHRAITAIGSVCVFGGQTLQRHGSNESMCGNNKKVHLMTTQGGTWEWLWTKASVECVAIRSRWPKNFVSFSVLCLSFFISCLSILSRLPSARVSCNATAQANRFTANYFFVENSKQSGHNSVWLMTDESMNKNARRPPDCRGSICSACVFAKKTLHFLK